ncbi:MAG TPA: hypothetical protein VFR81_20740 [Longimicrobium sp.]|nr:hypothetical protein [Longimicrobium sp.]
MSTLKERQISVRVPEDVDRWLEERAGGARKKAAFIRELVERERAAEREDELLRMFNRAAEDLTEEDREERERLVGAFAHKD